MTWASPDMVMRTELVGKWSVTGFLITLSSFSVPVSDRMDNLCSNCTVVN
jgi:hypothetical protein